MNKRAVLTALAGVMLLCGCSEKSHEDFVQSSMSSSAYATSLMRGDEGYYYNARTPQRALSLKYYDTGTGRTIYLCAKPECLHDGNIYCPATSSSYFVSASQYYEDNIYLSVMYYDDEGAQTKLVRAAKNGTELTEIAGFGRYHFGEDGVFFSRSMMFMVIHRGKAYVPYEIEGGERTKAIGIEEIDLDTGAHRSLIERETNGYFCNMTAEGDIVYFQELISTFDCIQYCYNMKTKELKSYPEKYITNCTAVNGRLLFTDSSTDWEVQSLNPENGEISGLSGDLSDFRPHWLTFDGQYIYALDEDSDTTSHGDGDMINGAIFTAEGGKLADFSYTVENAESLFGDQFYDQFCFQAENGIAYISNYNRLLSCPVEDILAGKCEWTEVLTFENEEP